MCFTRWNWVKELADCLTRFLKVVKAPLQFPGAFFEIARPTQGWGWHFLQK